MSTSLTNLATQVAQTVATESAALAAMTKLVPVEIAIINESTVLTDAQVAPAVVAIQTQVSRDFAPIYGKTARLLFFNKSATIPPEMWQIAILDDSDQAGALGYHDITVSGQPLGKVFAKTTQTDGLSWTVTLSHEALEMLQDPWINRCFEVDDGSGNPTQFQADEVGDPCITGDTRIALLDGTEKTIEELRGVPEFWVYSCTEDGKVVPGRAHSVRLTRKDVAIVEVLLDNGESIKCTADHQFMTRNGSYQDAGKLQSGDSLMALYRRLEFLPSKKSKTEYEQVFHPGSQEWQ